LSDRFAAHPQGAPWGWATRSTGEFSNGTSGENYSGINNSHKASIVALVEPRGRARAFHVKSANIDTVRKILVTNANRKSELHTDESSLNTKVGREFAAHKTVEHGGAGKGQGIYVAIDGTTTNAAENFFGNFKRSIKGTYRFCGEQHLQKIPERVSVQAQPPRQARFLRLGTDGACS
jgi:hypothetical protein